MRHKSSRLLLISLSSLAIELAPSPTIRWSEFSMLAVELGSLSTLPFDSRLAERSCSVGLSVLLFLAPDYTVSRSDCRAIAWPITCELSESCFALTTRRRTCVFLQLPPSKCGHLWRSYKTLETVHCMQILLCKLHLPSTSKSYYLVCLKDAVLVQNLTTDQSLPFPQPSASSTILSSSFGSAVPPLWSCSSSMLAGINLGKDP